MGSHQQQQQQGPCHRCGRGGHLARDCSLHTCFRCNGRGHMAWECVEGVICGKCGEKGHLQRNCKNVSCHKCGKKGHIARFCNDPFAKAAEVERLERQQALTASTRTSVLTFLAATAEENRVVVRSGMAPVVPHKEMRGPWDGLGVHRQDTSSLEKEQEQLGKLESSQNALLPRKRAASSSVQTVVSQRLKIVGVKSSQGDSQTSSRGDSPKRMENSSSPHQWEGVVGYGSEVSSSRGDSSKTLGNHSSPGQWEGVVGYGSEDSEEL